MTISWIAIATETERDITIHITSQTAVILYSFILASCRKSAPVFYAPKPRPPPAAQGAALEAFA